MRQRLADKGVGQREGFRWRGERVSRIEGFSDAAFGFALTLLVVSLEVPRSYDQLLATMWDFPAFAVCFTLLIMIWYFHYQFFRHYGLNDLTTVILNALLLFVVLFYVYPLKFVFSWLITGNLLGKRLVETVPFERMPSLMIIYGFGFFFIFLVFALLHGHAYRKREELELDELEIFDTRSAFRAHLLSVGVAALSISIAGLGIGGQFSAFISGMTYFLLFPAHVINTRRYLRLRQAMLVKAEPQQQ